MKTMLQSTFLMTVLLISGMAFAQPMFGGPGPGGHGKGMRNPEKMKMMRAKVLREVVGLDETRAAEVEAAMDGFFEQSRSLHESMRENMERLAELVKNDSNDDGAYQDTLEALRLTHEAMNDLRKEQMSSMKTLLGPKEQAKLLLAHSKMRHKARKFMRGKDGGKRGKGMGRNGRDCPGGGPCWDEE
jgi:Spy/CpxP family protein refolding chaperone